MYCHGRDSDYEPSGLVSLIYLRDGVYFTRIATISPLCFDESPKMRWLVEWVGRERHGNEIYHIPVCAGITAITDHLPSTLARSCAI